MQKSNLFVAGIILLFFSVVCCFAVNVAVLPNKSLRQHQLDLLELYGAFKRACNDHNIRCWATAGTLLGAVRHNGFIPHDDDMDFECSKEDYQKLLDVEEEITEKYGITLSKDPICKTVNMLKVHWKGSSSSWDAFLDVIPVQYDSVRRKTVMLPRIWGDTCSWEGDILRNQFEELPFEDTTVMAPKGNLSYLENCYGKNWRIPKKSASHLYFVKGTSAPTILWFTILPFAITTVAGFILLAVYHKQHVMTVTRT